MHEDTTIEKKTYPAPLSTFAPQPGGGHTAFAVRELETEITPDSPVEPKIGDDVFYSLASGPNKGQLRPAKVVHVWSSGMVNLVAFTDGYNDGTPYHTGAHWATSVHYDTSGEPNTWRRSLTRD